MITKIQTTIFLFLFFGLSAFGQTDLRSTPKKIKAKGDYFHTHSKTTFPLQFETFDRQSVNSFDRSDKNVGVIYNRKIGDKTSTLTIYIYPAGDGYEGRLRSEYMTSMQSIANLSETDFMRHNLQSNTKVKNMFVMVLRQLVKQVQKTLTN